MSEQSSLVYRIWCAACAGTEIWRLGRIVRALKTAGMPQLANESDIESVAEQLEANCKRICCPGCGRTGTIAVFRVMPGG